MITIQQLLESVDLDFEPRWITKDQNGMVWVWDRAPYRVQKWWNEDLAQKHTFGCIKFPEFEGKDWTECIYEVPRKTTGKIEKLMSDGGSHPDQRDFMYKINQIVDAINEIKGAKNE